MMVSRVGGDRLGFSPGVLGDWECQMRSTRKTVTWQRRGPLCLRGAEDAVSVIGNMPSMPSYVFRSPADCLEVSGLGYLMMGADALVEMAVVRLSPQRTLALTLPSTDPGPAYRSSVFPCLPRRIRSLKPMI